MSLPVSPRGVTDGDDDGDDGGDDGGLPGDDIPNGVVVTTAAW
ncbi:MAG: hypothetical protein R3E01_20175 [Pirellulaceae bacterium]